MRPNVLLPDGRVVPGSPHYADDPGDPPAVGWYLWLDLAFAQDLHDDRDKLPPVDGGYLIHLLIGADDGAARPFDVHIDWKRDAGQTANEVMTSALDRLTVRPRPRGGRSRAPRVMDAAVVVAALAVLVVVWLFAS